MIFVTQGKLIDGTLVVEDTNSINTDEAKREILVVAKCAIAMPIRGSVVPLAMF